MITLMDKVHKIYTNEYGKTISMVLTIESDIDYKSLLFSVERYRPLDDSNFEIGWRKIDSKYFTFADISALVQLYNQSKELQTDLASPF